MIKDEQHVRSSNKYPIILRLLHVWPVRAIAAQEALNCTSNSSVCVCGCVTMAAPVAMATTIQYRNNRSPNLKKL